MKKPHSTSQAFINSSSETTGVKNDTHTANDQVTPSSPFNIRPSNIFNKHDIGIYFFFPIFNPVASKHIAIFPFNAAVLPIFHIKNTFDRLSISSRYTTTTINNKPNKDFNGVLHSHTSNIKGVLLKDNENPSRNLAIYGVFQFLLLQ